LQTPAYLIGVDGGGTGTRAVVARADGSLLGQGSAGPSALGQGVPKAWTAITAAISEAFSGSGERQPEWQRCALCAGLSGASIAAWRKSFFELNPGFSHVMLETDAFAILLGAHDAAPGAIVAAGTGSVGEALHHDGQRRRASGWGFPVGDEGSGAWLGLSAMRHAQCVMDGRAQGGLMAQRIFEQCGRDRPALQDWCSRAAQYAYAQLAPVVFECAPIDPSADRLLDNAATALADIARAIDPAGKLPLAVTGTIGQRLADRLPQDMLARRVPPRHDAATGSLHWLMRDLTQHR
jgi:glucosamine kinase